MKLKKKYSLKDMYCMSSKFRNQLVTALFIIIGVLHFIPEKSIFIHYDSSKLDDVLTYLFIFSYILALFMTYFSICTINSFIDSEYEFKKFNACCVLGSIALLIIAKHFNAFSNVINYKSATYPILSFMMYYVILKIVIFIIQELIIAIVITFRKMQAMIHKRAFIPLTLEEMKSVDIKSMDDYENVINEFLCYSCSIFGENEHYYIEPLSYIDLVKSGIVLYEELNMFKPIYLNCKFNELDGFSFVYEESYRCMISDYDLENEIDTMYINK